MNDFRHGGRFPLHGPIPLDSMRSASCILELVLRSLSMDPYHQDRNMPDFSNTRFFGLHQVMEQSRWFK